jgi:hypothetical protein
MLHTFTQNAVNTNAKAKVLQNKKLGTVRLVVAFNVTEITKNGAYKFPVQSKCAYVSGDIDSTEVLSTLTNASSVLNTKNIQLVS